MIDPTFCGSRFSTGRLLAIEDFTFFLPAVVGQGKTARALLKPGQSKIVSAPALAGQGKIVSVAAGGKWYY